jgi:hypothetical protein
MSTRLAPSALALAALAAVAQGCAPVNTASIEPYALCAMPDDCKFTATCSAQFIGIPRLRVDTDEEMWLAFEMHNQLANNADENTGQANTHDAHFEAYSVDYSEAAGLLPPSSGELPSIGSSVQMVIPAGGTAVVGAYVIPQALVDELAASTEVPVGPDYVTVVLKVKFKGRYDDGTKWWAPFSLPVQLCRGALCVSHGCEDPTQTPLGACPNLSQFPSGVATCG